MVVTVKVQWHGKRYYKCKLKTQARNYSREPKKLVRCWKTGEGRGGNKRKVRSIAVERKVAIMRKVYQFPQRERRREKVQHGLRRTLVSWRSMDDLMMSTKQMNRDGRITTEQEINVVPTWMKISEDCPPWTHHFPSMIVKGTPVTFDLTFSHIMLTSSRSSLESKKSMACLLVSEEHKTLWQRSNLLFGHDTSLFANVWEYVYIGNIFSFFQVSTEDSAKERELLVLTA